MEMLREQPVLSPEEAARLEFEALLGAFEDRMDDDGSSQEERAARDALIFQGLKATLQNTEAMGNMTLLQAMTQRLAEVACNHEHFGQQLDAYGVFRRQTPSRPCRRPTTMAIRRATPKRRKRPRKNSSAKAGYAWVQIKRI